MVEWKEIQKEMKVLRGKRLTKNLLDDNASYPVFHGGIEPLGRFGEYNREANTVMVINVGASAGTVGFCDSRFWSSDGCFCISHSDNINSKFLYYFMLGKTHYLQSQVRYAGIPTLDNSVIEKIQIPIISLSEQNRIVGILDTFTSSIENLKQQIADRRKQLEHYRDQLLDLEGKKGVEIKTLGEFCDTLSGFPFDSTQFSEAGIRLMRGMNIKRGYFDFSEDNNKYWNSSEGLEKYLLEANDIIISMDGSLVGRSFCYLRKEHLPLLLVQRVARIRTKDNYKYVYYNIAKRFPDYVDKKKTAGAIPHISMKDINGFIIPLPSKEEQSRIVSILDTFEASIANLEAQLSHREKQYEYYRNKLLTFE